jgi:hypothetical protein
MKIREGDYKKILDHLVNQRWEGNEFVAFPDDSAAVRKHDLFCFATPEKAKEFSFEMSTDNNRYQYLAIRSLYRAMSGALQDTSLRIETAGLVNISAMVTAKEERMTDQHRINNKNNKVMNEKNLESLEKQLLYSGMGEVPREELIKNLQEGKPEFQLQFQKQYGDDQAHAVLNFKKSGQSDNYFYNSFDLTVVEQGKVVSPSQNFKTEYGNSYTMKEGYNLLMGRSAMKDFIKVDRENKDNNQAYQAWATLDFKNTDDKGNFKIEKKSTRDFNLADTLNEYPIKELATPKYHEELLDSLYRGNRQSVTFINGEQEAKRYIEANPKFKTINVYDADLNRISLSTKINAGQSESQAEQEKQGNSSRQSSKNSAKQGEDADDGPAEPNAKKKRGQRVG